MEIGGKDVLPRNPEASNPARGIMGQTQSPGESQLQIIFDNIADGVSVQDRNFRCFYTNRVGAQMCGYESPEEFISAPIEETLKRFELLTEDDQPLPLESLPARQALRGIAKPAEVIVKFRNKLTNETRISSVTARPVLDSQGAPYLAVSIFRDITASKNLELEIKQSARKFALLAEASSLLTSSLDYEKTLQALAQVTVPKLGDWCSIYTQEDDQVHKVAVSHSDPKMLEFAKAYNEKYSPDWSSDHGAARVLKTGESILIGEITEALLKEGSRDQEHFEIVSKLQFKSVMIVPLRGADRIWGVLNLVSTHGRRQFTRDDLAFAEEIGRRAGLAIDNAKLFRKAQDAIRARDEFLSIASHELRTPVTTLKLQAQMTKRRLEDGDHTVFDQAKLIRLVDSVTKQTDRLAKLVEDMLDISRIAHGKLLLHREPTELGSLVREVMDRFDEQFKSSGSKYRLYLESSVEGEWDRFRIEQVMTNLITNALKYGRGKPIEISVFAETSIAIIRVKDEGLGIARENLDRIFQRFERAVPASEISGLGLGLYISKQIIDAHGGRIRVESELGQGSCFTVELPT